MTADASGTEPVGVAEEDHSRSSDRNDDDSASVKEPTEPEDGSATRLSALPGPAVDFTARHLHPVAERVKGATTKLAATFNERVVPTTSRTVDDAKHGWRTRVAPSLESGKDAVASFFGKVTDAARRSNDKLREREPLAFRTFGEMGDGLTRRAATAMDTIKEGTRELRYGVADLMTRDPVTAADAARSDDAAADGDATRAEPTRARDSGAEARPNSVPVPELEPEPANPNALLGVCLEARAARDARAAPAPYAVLSLCQWLCASRAFLETPGALEDPVPREREDASSSEEDAVSHAADALLESFRANPAHLIGPDVPPRAARAALWRYLESLPEPPVAFSLYAALAREDPADVHAPAAQKSAERESEAEKSDAAEALVGLLPPARRAALECVLGLAARVVAAAASRGDAAEAAAAAAAAAVAPRVAWPRAGRWSPETTRRAFDSSTVLDPSSPSDRAAREARAVARCVARLIRRRVEQDARRGGGAAAERDDV